MFPDTKGHKCIKYLIAIKIIAMKTLSKYKHKNVGFNYYRGYTVFYTYLKLTRVSSTIRRKDRLYTSEQQQIKGNIYYTRIVIDRHMNHFVSMV